MTQTFTTQRFDPPKPCDACGQHADILFLADGPEDATGYRGEMALCKTCLEQMEAKAS